jgi:dihydroflavonol-4-reductase
MYLAGPLMGFSFRYIHRNVGVPLAIDNTKSIKALGLTYLPIRQTLQDSVDQLAQSGVLHVKR